MPGIPLGTIITKCTRLVSLLVITNDLTDEEREPKNFHVVRNWPLERLQLSVGKCYVQPYILKEVLSKAKLLEVKRLLENILRERPLKLAYYLQELTLIGAVEAFTDELLYKASDLNPFDFMRQVNLLQSKKITYEALECVFLKRKNPLACVSLIQCENVTMAHYEKYRQYLDDNKFKHVIFRWK